VFPTLSFSLNASPQHLYVAVGDPSDGMVSSEYLDWSRIEVIITERANTLVLAGEANKALRPSYHKRTAQFTGTRGSLMRVI